LVTGMCRGTAWRILLCCQGVTHRCPSSFRRAPSTAPCCTRARFSHGQAPSRGVSSACGVVLASLLSHSGRAAAWRLGPASQTFWSAAVQLQDHDGATSGCHGSKDELPDSIHVVTLAPKARLCRWTVKGHILWLLLGAMPLLCSRPAPRENGLLSRQSPARK
jgi:hypothetical protein